MALVSIVVPCFNARRWISDTLASVFAQTKIELEVIVVDDGSTDGSADVIATGFPTVTLMRTHRRGPSGARNAGTRAASGEFIQYLDADDLLAPRKLERQLRALDVSGADVAYGAWQELLAQLDGTFTQGLVHAKRIGDSPEISLFTDVWCPPAVYLFRRRIVDKVGGWNESLPIVQDARFVLDCALQGARFVYCAGIMAQYRVHQTDSVSTRDRRAFVRDRLHNARSVEGWWADRRQLTPDRVEALVKVYGQVARDAFQGDTPSFEAALSDLERLQPGYVPRQPWHLALASRVVGYRRAEALAVHYRRAKRLLRPRG